MGPVFHMTVGVIATLVLKNFGVFDSAFFGGENQEWLPYAVFFLWSSLLIDLDHVVLFLLKGKGSPRRALQLGLKDFHNMHPHPFLFHTLEFNIFLVVAAFFIPIMRVVLLGTIYHIAFDILAHYRYYHHFKWMKAWVLSKQIKLG